MIRILIRITDHGSYEYEMNRIKCILLSDHFADRFSSMHIKWSAKWSAIRKMIRDPQNDPQSAKMIRDPQKWSRICNIINLNRWISFFNVGNCCLNDEKRFLSFKQQLLMLNNEIQCWKLLFEQWKPFFIVQTTTFIVEQRSSTLEIVVWTMKNVFYRSNNNF